MSWSLGARFLLSCQRRLQNPKIIDFGDHIVGAKIVSIVSSFMAFMEEVMAFGDQLQRYSSSVYKSKQQQFFYHMLNSSSVSDCMACLSRTGNGICQRRSCLSSILG